MRVLFRSGRSGRLFFLPPPRSCNGRLPESRQWLSSARSVRASDPQSLLLIVVFFLFWFDGGTADSCLRASPAGGQDESLADLYRKAPRGKGAGRRWRPGLTRASDVLDLDDLVGLGAVWGHHLDGVEIGREHVCTPVP